MRDGILNHRGQVTPVTLEGQIVKICDRIAYVNHDIDDAVRAGVISMEDLPSDALRILGSTHSDRINNLIVDLCSNSEGRDRVTLSPDVSDALLALRSYMFANVYGSESVLKACNADRVELIITSLYNYYLEYPDELPGIYQQIREEDGIHTAVKDWVSGMTDRFALNTYSELFEQE